MDFYGQVDKSGNRDFIITNISLNDLLKPPKPYVSSILNGELYYEIELSKNSSIEIVWLKKKKDGSFA